MSVLQQAKKYTTLMLIVAIILCAFVAFNGEGINVKLAMLAYAILSMLIILAINGHFSVSLIGDHITKDALLGGAMGIGFIVLNELQNSVFSLGAPASLLSLGNAGLFLAIVIVAPIVEEMFFRGLLLKYFQNTFNTWFAVIATSLLFALFHFSVYAGFLGAVKSNIGLFIGAFVFAFVMAWVVVGKKGQPSLTLERSIVAHGLINFWLLNATVHFINI